MRIHRLLLYFRLGPLVASFFNKNRTASLEPRFDRLYLNRDASIVKMDRKKIYPNFSRLVFHPTGIYLQSNIGELIPVDNLSYRKGKYEIVRLQHWKCTYCGKVNKNECLLCNKCSVPKE